LPTEGEEVWRYSGIDSFDIDAYAPANRPSSKGITDPSADLALASQVAAPLGARCALVVTRDGTICGIEIAPDLNAESVLIASARVAFGSTEAPPGLGELSVARDAFGELHDAFLTDALIVDVPPKVVVSDPVVVVHFVSATTTTRTSGSPSDGLAPACFPRTQVRVGASGEVGVIELFVSPEGARAGGGPAGLVVPVTELEVAEDARLRYANLQALGPELTEIALQSSRIGQRGSLSSFTAGLGGRYARVRTDSDLVGESADSSLSALYLGTGDQVHDFRTLQDHHAPNTRSELLFKGAVADSAHSVYSGLIRIARGAHGSDAFQTNHNLVLSEGAHADSVPNLDIDENDVRCSHASTVGPLDEDQLYYLESRGIEPWVAERLIVLGFFSELAARAPFTGVGALVEDSVRERLSGRTIVSGPLGSAGDAGNG
jgi:Fe-S cluster assembly protein SufD